MEDQNIIYGGDLENSEAFTFASLGEMIIENLKRNGEKRNFIEGTTGRTFSNNEIVESSVKISKALYNIGIKENDAVAIISENCTDFISIVFGTWFLNAVSTPINVTYTERELKHALQLSKPKVIFASSAALKNVISACKELSFVKYLIHLDEQNMKENLNNFRGFINTHSKNSFDVYQHVKCKVNTKDKTSVIFLSSGTTGLPKGVEITQRNIMEVMQGYSESINEYKKVTERLASLAIAPWFHVLGLVNVVIMILTGQSTVVFLPKFIPELYLKSIEKFEITILIVAPPIVVFLAKTPLFHKYDLSSLKAIYCGAAPLSSHTEEELKKRFKTKIFIMQGYGMSETTYSIIGSPQELKPGSIGHVLKGNYAKVINEKGNSLGPNQRGELCFKGLRIMKGYLNNPKATAETIDKDGWLHTGDIAYYDEDKQFYIVDRLKELIKYKAFQVAPAELEGLLLSNPKIKDAGVIGIHDELAGELPFAFVVKQPGADLIEQEVNDFVAENASNAKWLRGGVKFVDEIPKNPSGKILRRELRELFRNTRSKL
ncbi:hypothetical protein ACKWTF_001977 [Chironomus riparius]